MGECAGNGVGSVAAQTFTVSPACKPVLETLRETGAEDLCAIVIRVPVDTELDLSHNLCERSEGLVSRAKSLEHLGRAGSSRGVSPTSPVCPQAFVYSADCKVERLWQEITRVNAWQRTYGSMT